jgi:hypothetical protein
LGTTEQNTMEVLTESEPQGAGSLWSIPTTTDTENKSRHCDPKYNGGDALTATKSHGACVKIGASYIRGVLNGDISHPFEDDDETEEEDIAILSNYSRRRKPRHEWDIKTKGQAPRDSRRAQQSPPPSVSSSNSVLMPIANNTTRPRAKAPSFSWAPDPAMFFLTMTWIS